MFARDKRIGPYTYVYLVENVREDGRTRQRIIANLGRKEAVVARGDLDRLARSVARLAQRSMVLAAVEGEGPPRAVCRRIGPALLFERLWQEIGCRAVLDELAAQRQFGFAAERAVFLTVLHRLFVSGSDRAAEKWRADYRIDGTEELQLHHLYRAMAWLGEPLADQAEAGGLVPRCRKDLVEEALFARRRDLFAELSVVFMDTTSLSFEGQGGEALGRHGHSKDHRPDLHQMIVGLVMDQDGRPLCCELWPGNTADVTTLLPVVMTRSLYPPSSSVCKHCKLIFAINTTRATGSPDRCSHPFMSQVVRTDLVGSARYNLLGGKDAVVNQSSDAVARDAERCGGFRHREPVAVLRSGTVGMDTFCTAQRADTPRGPGFSMASRYSHPVQRRGDILVRPSGRHRPDYGERLVGCTAAMLAGVRFANAQLRVLAAAPMDRQDDLTRRLVDIGDDVGDQGTQQPLACAHCDTRRVPCELEIVGQASEVGRHGNWLGRLHRFQLRLARLDAAKRRLPTLLELGSDQAIVGIAGGVAPFRERSFISSLL